MPTFMQSLANNPGGIYNPYPQQDTSFSDVLNLSNQVKERDLQDFMKKAQFMSDLSLRQNRMQRIYDMQDAASQQQDKSTGTVMGHDPYAEMTAYERGELGVRQQAAKQQTDIESQRLSQQGRLGQEAIDVRSAQERLNQQKSDQISAQKQADMQHKIDESNSKIELAQRTLADRTKTTEEHLANQKEYQSLIEERHKLEMARKDATHKDEMDKANRTFQENQRMHDAQIKNYEDIIKKRGQPTTSITDINPEQTRRVTTTTRGEQRNAPSKQEDGTYNVTGRNGKQYNIQASQLGDWMQNHDISTQSLDQQQ